MAARKLNARVGDDSYAAESDGRVVSVQREGATEALSFETQYLGHGRVAVRRDGVTRIAWVVEEGETRWVYAEGEVTLVDVTDGAARRARRAASEAHPMLAAPMPATVVRIPVTVGARVARGATLVLLEAMKMELPLRAPQDAVVVAIHCREGELVQPNVALVELDAAAAPTGS